ncbi:hypothetical protein E4N76_03745 [Treponema putidum]|uniref:Bacterial repeat domain-containing protein n=1 Tax=Treponema putidum TaxID=221027 RepID=A0ABY5I0Q3_9SPIR|nr:hypothetical protein E4N76_03745 [Treponema putidum]
MRKRLTFLKTLIAAVAVILLFTACEQFLKDPEDFLSYWASEAFVKDHSIGSAVRPDGAGVPCVSSSEKVTIMLTVHNPKGFSFVLPTSSEPAGIVEFKELFVQPTVGTHYKLGRTASGRLKLTYTKDFLQKYEQGSGSLNPTITLKATDGRVFKKTYTFGIKSNTPPPAPKEIVIAKTTGTNPHYVLCLKFDSTEMTKTAAMNSGSAPVHKDIRKITINDSPYDLLYKEDNSDFKKPNGDSFVEHGNVEKLTSSSPDVPSGAWVLYYKTNIRIVDGNEATSYTITLSDKEGVTSDKAVATIAASGPTHTVTFSVENPTGGTLTAQVDGMNIASGSAVERGKTVTFTANPNTGWEVDSWEVSPGSFESGGGIGTSAALNVTADTTVKVRFKKTTYKVTFSVDGANGTLKATVEGSEIHSGDDVEKGKTVYFTATPDFGWKVEGWTLNNESVSGTNVNYTSPGIAENTTVTVKFKKKKTVNSSDDNAWTLLKKAVEIADDGATITINGEIKASVGNCGEIVIDKNLTIKGKTGADTDILDASKMSRIFKVASGKTLTLENLTLKGGKADGAEDADKCGGAIYAKDASEIKIENCIITGNEAETNGGGIYVESTYTKITNCTFTKNTARDGGGIYITKTGSHTYVLEIIDGTIGGTGQANEATRNGGGIYVGQSCILNLKDSTDSGTQGVRITGNQAPKGGGVYAANNADVIMQGGTQINVYNDVYLDSRSAIVVNKALTSTDTVARITVPKDDYNTSTKVLYGNAVGSEHGKFIVTPKGNQQWKVNSYGRLQPK